MPKRYSRAAIAVLRQRAGKADMSDQPKDLDDRLKQYGALLARIKSDTAALVEKLYTYWFLRTSGGEGKRKETYAALRRGGLSPVSYASWDSIQRARWLADNLVLPVRLTMREELEAMTDAQLADTVRDYKQSEAEKLQYLGREAEIAYLLDESVMLSPRTRSALLHLVRNAVSSGFVSTMEPGIDEALAVLAPTRRGEAGEASE